VTKFAPKSAPESAPRESSITATATRGEHGLWYIRGTAYAFTRSADGVFRIYAPGCEEDGMIFARSTGEEA
jgi:hypothetical protein